MPNIDIQSAALGIRTVAEIHADPRGGPIRTIITGRHSKPTGRYASQKARRSLPWENRTERSFFWLCEADAEVVTYLCQPHCLELKLQGRRPLLFYPDVRRDMANGTVQIRELKSRSAARRAADPAYDLKLDLAREVYAGLGWDFDLLNEEHDVEKPRDRLENAWTVQRWRQVKVETSERAALIDAIERAGGTMPFARAAEAIEAGAGGKAKLCAAVVRRIVHVPLPGRLQDAPVTLALRSPEARG